MLPDRPEVVPYYDLDLGRDAPAAHDAHPWSQPVPTPKKKAEERLRQDKRDLESIKDQGKATARAEKTEEKVEKKKQKKQKRYAGRGVTRSSEDETSSRHWKKAKPVEFMDHKEKEKVSEPEKKADTHAIEPKKPKGAKIISEDPDD